MEKGIIFIREPQKWQTNIADEIIKAYHPAEVSYVNAQHFDKRKLKYIWDSCSEHTKLVVIDNVFAPSQLNDLAYTYNIPKIVNRKHSDPFIINPRMVLICDNHLSTADFLQDESLKCRFDIIYCEPLNNSTPQQINA